MKPLGSRTDAVLKLVRELREVRRVGLRVTKVYKLITADQLVYLLQLPFLSGSGSRYEQARDLVDAITLAAETLRDDEYGEVARLIFGLSPATAELTPGQDRVFLPHNNARIITIALNPPWNTERLNDVEIGMVVERSAREPERCIVHTPIAPEERLIVRASFSEECIPQRLWTFEDLLFLESPGDPSHHPGISVNLSGYAEAQFRRTQRGLAYGIGWTW